MNVIQGSLRTLCSVNLAFFVYTTFIYMVKFLGSLFLQLERRQFKLCYNIAIFQSLRSRVNQTAVVCRLVSRNHRVLHKLADAIFPLPSQEGTIGGHSKKQDTELEVLT